MNATASRLRAPFLWIKRVRIDPMVASLVVTLVLASILPCHGVGAHVFGWASTFAIATLFFLQGARLSRDAILNGLTHWRLHLAIFGVSFALFPIVGLLEIELMPSMLPSTLWLGVLFICTLPTTIQSSIALTSIAQGNVAGAVCSVTVSNLAGIVLGPLLFSGIARVSGATVNIAGIWQVLLQLLLPFIVGHLARPWIGAWAERNRKLLKVTDRGSILLVVYSAFSAAVVGGMGRRVPLATFAELLGIVVSLVVIALAATIIGSRSLGFDRADQAAVVFCGSQKSLVNGVPIANLLFPASLAGVVLLPIMTYYPLQLVACTWLARRYAMRPAAAAAADPALVRVVARS